MSIIAHEPPISFDAQPPNCPTWCDQGHEVEHEFGETWASHTGTFEHPIEGTDDRDAVAWVDSLNEDAPRLTVAFDRPDRDGDIRRYEGLPPGGMTPAEAAALTVAIQKATAAVAGRETTR